MQAATADTVLGDFNNASFSYNGTTTRFFQRDDKFIVNTDGEEGELQDFEVAYVFGVYPLQQYLLPLSRGRLQALSIAWDARPKAQGGQRWYHLYPEETIDHADPLHWTGPYQNWNTRCAECHSTDLKKNFDSATNSFDTKFEEINVGCEACHGPGERHIQWVKAAGSADKDTELKLKPKLKNSGFPIDLGQRGQWAFPTDQPIAQRTNALTSNTQIDNCARCHSRRGTLGDYHYGADLLDTHRLSLLQQPLYYADGQIRDEVYVHGSFIQSKMHMAGVVCSNCHEPHSLELRAPDNGVCAQCHAPAVYDNEKHHHHSKDSSGALCANCHMPETTYMGVDPRRDHSMRIPRPDLSVVMGTPNACNQCHQDQDADWAVSALRGWSVHFRDTSRHPSRMFHRFDQGDDRVIPNLAAIANSNSTAPIWRATAMEALGRAGGRDALQTATQLLYDDDPLLRTSTVAALQFLPIQQRLQLLTPLIKDPVKSVRMEVAASLSSLPLDQLTPKQLPTTTADDLRQIFAEYLETLEEHADMPSMQLQLGIFHVSRGDTLAAESAYRKALAINKQLLPAYLNLADLLRGLGRDDEARNLLKKALGFAPDNGPTLHALGLLETRSKNTEAALDYLGRAAAQETSGTRHRFVYAIALHDLGKPREAITQLASLLRAVPDNTDVLLALANYHRELGEREKALGYASQLVRIAPGNQSFRALAQQLTEGVR